MACYFSDNVVFYAHAVYNSPPGLTAGAAGPPSCPCKSRGVPPSLQKMCCACRGMKVPRQVTFWENPGKYAGFCLLFSGKLV